VSIRSKFNRVLPMLSECGSADLHRILNSVSPFNYLSACGLRELPRKDSSREAVLENERCAQRCFMAVLTARVLVFQCLLAAFEACGKKTKLDVLRKIWLFTQVDLRILERPGYFDLFSESTLLCYMPAYNTIDRYASDMLRACNVFLKSLTPGCRYLPFFAVVDEAQTAAEAFPYAFRGTPDSHEVDENGGEFRNEVPRRLALRQLLCLWEEMLHLIVTGTSLNLKYITESVSSSIAKDSARAIKVQDTGSHVNKEDQINRYLEYYLPPGHLNTPTGKELLQRARYWLVGRQVLFRPDRALYDNF
ncbi:hypothetical protein H0H92_011590, partial [Tricholoma furcatifolium]